MARFEASRTFLLSRHARPAGLVALGAMLAACQSILGIEDLSSGPDPSKGGMGQAGTTGATGGKGGSTSGGSAGSAAARGGTAGNTGGSAGAGARGGSSSGGDAGKSSGGSSGLGETGGSAGNAAGGSSGGGGTTSGNGGEGGMAPEGSPITGMLIDFWRHPVPNVTIYVGDATATTDANGVFTIPDVPPTYDAACVISLDDPARVYEWAFLGLTRRDPTLQVREAFPHYEAHFYVTQTGASGFADDEWLYAAGSDSGADTDAEGPGGFDRRPYWWGSATEDWTLHSLFLTRTGGVPTAFLNYDTLTATITDTALQAEEFMVDLSTPRDIDSGKVSGAIVDDTGVGRTNSVFLRFTSGAPMALIDRIDASANAYEYPVPKLANSSITVAAAETHADDSYSVAHRDNRSVDDTGVDLVIPHPVTGLVPIDGAVNVGPDTPFTFNEGDPDNSGYLIHIENVAYNQGLYIVTASRQVKLSDVQILHDVIAPNSYHNWLVETHGQFASVDAMAGPNGYMDAFGNNNYRPWGPHHTDGAFTTSGLSYFTTAP